MKATVIVCRLGVPRFAKHNGQEVTLNTWIYFPARASLSCTFPRLLQSIARCLMVDTSNKLLKVRDEHALKGCIHSIIAFEFETYISSKMPHHVDTSAVNYSSLRHCYKLCMAVLPYQDNFACADLYTCRVQMTGKTDNRPEYRTPCQRFILNLPLVFVTSAVMLRL
jgi:hypothetical protein